MSKSSYESHIASILSSEYIEFITEKIFPDCYNGYYRFDFYLPNENICIEVNGEQHYKYSRAFYKTSSEFKKAQERDRRKISYCLARGIKLYIVPYWDIFQISCSADIFQEKYLARSKFHNDEKYRTQKSRERTH